MIISKVEVKGNIVNVHLDDKSTFSISLETYLENSILIGEEISKEEIIKIKNDSNRDLVKVELIDKLARKKLSKKECFQFLKERFLSSDEANAIIDELEKNYLINDRELIEFVIDYALMRKKGIDRIKANLIDRGLSFDENFVEEYIDSEKYRQNIIYLIEKYKKMGKSKSNKVLKLFLTEKMIENGYRREEFDYLIGEEKNDEKEIIIKEISKILKNREMDDEIIAKITKKLLSKGFNYAIIKEAIRSVVENETY